MSLKYFVELPCDNVEIISAEIYKFFSVKILQKNTNTKSYSF
jgi:hypothetical protein